ncbi:uncharacterized isomerase bh0283 [Phtheirospermum japonicum]|uniref:Uncharacterized isomerase bh0283 n=1 Tax=Phtheirospermum japonicum TaxID=374723 RepID=A0A830DD96_9LAMI|nr:uncharacterized isomerase bh0283 [Phtheirospermum japonicum]
MAKKSAKYSAIDAFTDSAFKGNPAAVFLLEEERDEEWLQAVAREFNLSETCYLTRLSEPAQSTIGSVPRLPNSSNGNASDNFIIELDFPVDTVMEYNGAADVLTVSKSLNGASVVLPSGEAVVETEPHFDEIRKFPGRGMIITGLAPTGSGFDFFSRFFCPKLGVNEDSVTASANCALAAYWGKQLGKCDLIAYQASPRSDGLDLHHDVKNQRVLLRGKAVAVMEGSLLFRLNKDGHIIGTEYFSELVEKETYDQKDHHEESDHKIKLQNLDEEAKNMIKKVKHALANGEGCRVYGVLDVQRVAEVPIRRGSHKKTPEEASTFLKFDDSGIYV